MCRGCCCYIVCMIDFVLACLFMWPLGILRKPNNI